VELSVCGLTSVSPRRLLRTAPDKRERFPCDFMLPIRPPRICPHIAAFFSPSPASRGRTLRAHYLRDCARRMDANPRADRKLFACECAALDVRLRIRRDLPLPRKVLSFVSVSLRETIEYVPPPPPSERNVNATLSVSRGK